jgi:hypothetical protein
VGTSALVQAAALSSTGVAGGGARDQLTEQNRLVLVKAAAVAAIATSR